MTRRAVAALVALVILAAAAAVLATQSAAATSVSVGLHDYYITRTPKSVPHGIVTFHIRNDGAVTHNFHIRHGTTGTVIAFTANLVPGATATKSLTLKAGTYTIYCSIHPTLMHRTFTVT
jgi:plastocyanin